MCDLFLNIVVAENIEKQRLNLLFEILFDKLCDIPMRVSTGKRILYKEFQKFDQPAAELQCLSEDN